VGEVMGTLKDRVTIALAVVLLALVGIEWQFTPHDHPRFAWHHIAGYAALIGLFASLLVIVLAKGVGKKMLQRPDLDDD
jgi:hypothetical protein